MRDFIQLRLFFAFFFCSLSSSGSDKVVFFFLFWCFWKWYMPPFDFVLVWTRFVLFQHVNPRKEKKRENQVPSLRLWEAVVWTTPTQCPPNWLLFLVIGLSTPTPFPSPFPFSFLRTAKHAERERGAMTLPFLGFSSPFVAVVVEGGRSTFRKAKVKRHAGLSPPPPFPFPLRFFGSDGVRRSSAGRRPNPRPRGMKSGARKGVAAATKKSETKRAEEGGFGKDRKVSAKTSILIPRPRNEKGKSGGGVCICVNGTAKHVRLTRWRLIEARNSPTHLAVNVFFLLLKVVFTA